MGAMYGLAAIAGPLLGGAFTSSAKLTWGSAGHCLGACCCFLHGVVFGW